MSTEYDRVREAFADIMFSSAQAGRPVYALAGTEMIRNVLQSADIEDLTLAGLAAVVRSSLQIDERGVAPFRWQAESAQRHRRDPLETPPALPLLVVLSIAAEQMHADGELAAHNYYSRLHRILQVPTTERTRVESDYRRVADLLWGSLNSWLEAWEGERGIPTAYAVGGHAFIGLPMSQAVVRQHDRAGLHELFAMEGMTPGVRISPADMCLAMDPYATAAPSPLSSHLAQLWRDPAARERIVDAACLELETWDGSGIEAAASSRAAVTARLLAFLQTFPRKSIEFNLMLPYRSEGPSIARFQLAEAELIVPTVASPGGSTRIFGSEGVSASSLVGDQLVGEFGEDNGRPFGRQPKRVVPLRWDDFQAAFVEVESISLGEDSILLVRADACQRVQAHLTAHARPGWREVADLPGLPEGWAVYQHVQIVSAPTGLHVDLLPLAPRARTSLTLRGGFVLPGLLRKWSAMDPPEVIAVAAGASVVEVRVYRGTRINRNELVLESAQPGELVVLPLADRGLSDGEYVVAMFVDGASKPSSTALLRLRSANTPQFRVEDVDIRLVYSRDSLPRWPLTAGPADWPSYVNGARTVSLQSRHDGATGRMPEFVLRTRSMSTAAVAKTRVGVPMASDSCLVTGMHRFQLPPVLPGQMRTHSVVGECTTCGLVRRFAGTPWAARKKDGAARMVVTPEIPPVTESDEPDFEVVFDALNHIGAGSFGVFERIAAQVEGSGVFADAYLRRLEVVGHVDVARDDYLRVTDWAVNSSTLVPTGDGTWVLIGSRSRGLLEKVEDLVGTEAVVRTTVDAELARVEVAGRLPIAALADAGITVLQTSPAMTIAQALPPLSELARSLKRVVVPSHRTAEFWDTASASWQPAASLVKVGAYRLKDFGSTYAIRDEDDIASGTIGVGNAQIVKHIANLWAGDPLIGYHSRSGSVVTPLGADLPALYGRALSLCSGRAPREIVNHHMLQYPSVPRSVADVIYDRMSR